MESSDDLSDMIEFWEAELDEDGARKDRMPLPLPVSTENMRLISLSRKSILLGLIKEIPARDPVFDTWYRYRGFFTHVRVYVPDLADATKFREEFCSSFQEFSTAEEAEEKAAENMIRILEATCKFEVKDLNWEMKQRFHVDSFNSCTGWRAAKDEICALKIKMEEMRKGWRSTLEGVDRWCDHIRSCGVGYAEDAFPFVLQEGVIKFESVCEEEYSSVYSSSL